MLCTIIRCTVQVVMQYAMGNTLSRGAVGPSLSSLLLLQVMVSEASLPWCRNMAVPLTLKKTMLWGVPSNGVTSCASVPTSGGKACTNIKLCSILGLHSTISPWPKGLFMPAQIPAKMVTDGDDGRLAGIVVSHETHQQLVWLLGLPLKTSNTIYVRRIEGFAFPFRNRGGGIESYTYVCVSRCLFICSWTLQNQQ